MPSSVLDPSCDPRLGSDLLWRDVRAAWFARPAPALFLDRDGVIIEEMGYIARPEDVRLLAGIAELIAGAKALGMAVVEVTNQAGIARGYFGWSDFVRVEDRVTELLAAQGASIDAVFACPYHPEGRPPYRLADHAWRKPNPGMIQEAAQLLHLHTRESVLVGDKELDQMAARAAGLKFGIHVLTGYGKERQAAALAAASEAFPVYIACGASGCLPLLQASMIQASTTQASIEKDQPCGS